jgi:hypothetical protein
MNTLEINRYLKKFPQFKGTYPRDMLPTINRLPACVVINTDPSNEPGEHWVAVFIDRNGSGNNLTHLEYHHFMKKCWSFYIIIVLKVGYAIISHFKVSTLKHAVCIAKYIFHQNVKV